MQTSTSATHKISGLARTVPPIEHSPAIPANNNEALQMAAASSIAAADALLAAIDGASGMTVRRRSWLIAPAGCKPRERVHYRAAAAVTTTWFRKYTQIPGAAPTR
jgi:hypothetical protein